MTMWDLPNPDGPKWAGGWPVLPNASEGLEVIDTPWHFPVQGKDGLGEMLGGRHRRRAEEHGVTDPGRWEMYSRLLMIDFWEGILRSRYVGRKRPPKKVTRVISVLAELTGCDESRVEQLRKQLRELRKDPD